ncbi:MAG: NAD-dependent epimerase/dehydratase family protein [Aureliella sp.]
MFVSLARRSGGVVSVILVTGSTGLLGNTIVRQLVEAGDKVRVLCRQSSDTRPLDGLDVEIVRGELNNAAEIDAAVEGCRAVIHCAAMIHLGQAKLAESREVNVAGTLRLAQACSKIGARFVYISTINTFNAAESPDKPLDETNDGGVEMTSCAYVISKREAEAELADLALQTTLDYVIVHPGFLLGPNDWKPSSGRMMLEVVRTPVVAAPPGSCSVCDARDVAAAIVSSVDCGGSGEHYILAGENMPYADLWQNMIRVAGRRRIVYRLKPRVRHVGPVIDGLKKLLRRDEGDVNGTSLAMGCLHHCYRSDKAEQHLGYARRPLDETLSDTWQWLKTHHLEQS